MTTRYDLDRDGLGALLAGEPRYRVDQVWQGLYRQRTDPDAMTSLPLRLRERLRDELPRALTAETDSVTEDGDTVKRLWRLRDGPRIETVLMHYPDRATV